MSKRRDKWDELYANIADTVAAWRREHPEATLMEIEETVGVGVAAVSRQIVEDLAQVGWTADLKALRREERPACPACGEPVIANGSGRRRLTTAYD